MQNFQKAQYKRLPDLAFLEPRRRKAQRGGGGRGRGTVIAIQPSQPKYGTQLNHISIQDSDTHRGADSTHTPFSPQSPIDDTPTPKSLISPESRNRDEMPQLAALKHAKTWFDGATNRLRERLALAEEMSSSLDQLLQLLSRLENMQTTAIQTTSILQTNNEQENNPANSMATDERQDPATVPSDDNLTNEANVRQYDDNSPEHVSIDEGGGNSDDNNDLSHSKSSMHNTFRAMTIATNPSSVTPNLQTDTEAVEHAATEWIKRVRVLRAKWNAGGKNMEQSTGTRA